MAIAIPSFNTQAVDGVTSITITKPTDLGEGDLMVAFINASLGTANASAAGWTEIYGGGGAIFGANTANSTCLAKIADSSDVAASNFTFNLGAGVNDETVGHLLRITSSEGGFDIDDLLNFTNGYFATSPSVSLTGTTPVSSNQLLLIHIFSSGSVSTSAYAVATDNPTWTELTDATYFGDRAVAVAYANRTANTATGNYSFTSSTGTDGFCALLAINEVVDSTFNASPLVLTTSVPNSTVTGDANYTPDPLALSTNLVSPTVTAQQNTSWNNEDLPPTTDWEISEKIT